MWTVLYVVQFELLVVVCGAIWYVCGAIWLSCSEFNSKTLFQMEIQPTEGAVMDSGDADLVIQPTEGAVLDIGDADVEIRYQGRTLHVEV